MYSTGEDMMTETVSLEKFFDLESGITILGEDVQNIKKIVAMFYDYLLAWKTKQNTIFKGALPPSTRALLFEEHMSNICPAIDIFLEYTENCEQRAAKLLADFDKCRSDNR
jgi:hypothetical protein